ncbi:MAG: acyl-CoA thioesterase [Actinomycetota bacterium]
MTAEPKTPSHSRTVLVRQMEFADANLANNVHGGVIMRMADSAAGIAAVKHCGSRVVTAAMDEMSFIEPVFLGEIVTVYAMVNDVGKSSMEVGVRIEAENARSSDKRHVASAYLVFVALDEQGRPISVSPLVPENDEERRRMEEAKIRRAHRLSRKEAILARRQAKGEVS